MSRISILMEKDLRTIVKLDVRCRRLRSGCSAFAALATKAVARPPILRRRSARISG